MKLEKNNPSVVIRMTSTRTKVYTDLNNGQPVVEGNYEVYIIVPVTYEEGEWQKYGAHKTVNKAHFKLRFRTKEEAKAAANTLRENAKPLFLAFYKKEGKVTMTQLKEMTNAL